jgi:RluA family pseudouridine synthase
MAKPTYIELGSGRFAARIPILYEDRSVIAIDKPPGWMLVPFSWQKTSRNLQAAITSSIAAGDFWARSRNLKFLRFVHRLDADTSGALLFGRSPGAVEAYGDLFESRRMEKRYLAVVRGVPKQAQWVCRLKLAPDPERIGRVRVEPRKGKEAETHFRVLQQRQVTHLGALSLIEACPLTGRMHQIRVHLADSGCPVLGDDLYDPQHSQSAAARARRSFPLALRAVFLGYTDPFTRRGVRIEAPREEFLGEFEFAAGAMST